jgi:hypothetical protein
MAWIYYRFFHSCQLHIPLPVEWLRQPSLQIAPFPFLHGGIDHYIDPDETDGFKTTLLIVSIIGGVVVLRFINRN